MQLAINSCYTQLLHVSMKSYVLVPAIVPRRNELSLSELEYS